MRGILSSLMLMTALLGLVGCHTCDVCDDCGYGCSGYGTSYTYYSTPRCHGDVHGHYAAGPVVESQPAPIENTASVDEPVTK